MKNNTTKQKILDEALSLFSVKGYNAVSVEEIATAVGIKAPSLYKHFTSKKDIFDSLMLEFEKISLDFIMQFQNFPEIDITKTTDLNKNLEIYFFEGYLMDDFCNKILRVLIIEKNNSTKLQNLCNKWLIEEPIDFQRQIFAKVYHNRDIDFDYLATKFYAPIFLYTQQYLLNGKLTDKKKSRFIEKAKYHLSKFFIEVEVL